MAKRKSLSRKKSRKLFTKTSGSNRRNSLTTRIMRGGIRM